MNTENQIDNLKKESGGDLSNGHTKSENNNENCTDKEAKRQAEKRELQDKLNSIEETKEFLLGRTTHRPSVAVICGTGLGGLADVLSDTKVFPYEDIPNFPISSVHGHAGKLVFGTLGGKSVVCMQGRVHAYEGLPMWNITFPVRVFAALGVKIMLVTNASGGLNPEYAVGDVMILKDHINFAGLAGRNPFVGLNDERFGTRFCAMTGAYDKDLRSLVWKVSRDLNVDYVREGVYFCQIGPCFETAAESRMIRLFGADAAGMSTVFEVSVARHAGLRVLGLSLITNLCLIDCDSAKPHASHAETLESGRIRSEDLKRFVSRIIAELPV